MQKLETVRFALAGGIYGAGLIALTTICTLLDLSRLQFYSRSFTASMDTPK